MKTLDDLARRIAAKTDQYNKAAERAATNGTKHDADNLTATRRALHALAVSLAKLTDEPAPNYDKG